MENALKSELDREEEVDYWPVTGDICWPIMIPVIQYMIHGEGIVIDVSEELQAAYVPVN